MDKNEHISNYTDFLTDPQSIRCDIRLTKLRIADISVDDQTDKIGQLSRTIKVSFAPEGKGMYNVAGQGMTQVDSLLDFSLTMNFVCADDSDRADFDLHSEALVNKLKEWQDADTLLRFYSEPGKHSVLCANRNDYIPVARGGGEQAVAR